MAGTLPIPPALYDYVLYYECASKDWKAGSKKTKIKGDGSLCDMINWNSTYSYDPDDAGGKTLFGITEKTWQSFVKSYPEKGYSSDLNSMGKQGWFDVIEYFWNDYSYAGRSANLACAFVLFQMAWGGFGPIKSLINTLKENADIKDYNFTESKVLFKQVSDATHAYTDPMVAYDYIRNAKSSYLYNISTPDKTNKKYRVGWLTRNTLSFTAYGLFIPISFTYKDMGLKYESTLDQWENAANHYSLNDTTGYVKIIDWERHSIEKEEQNSNEYNFLFYTSNDESSNKESNPYILITESNPTGSYKGCNNVQQLGGFSNTTSSNKQIAQNNNKYQNNREEVLNVLIKGSYSPNEVIKCLELLTADKKKNIKA